MTSRYFKKVILAWSILLSFLGVIGSVLYFWQGDSMMQSSIGKDLCNMPLIGGMFHHNIIIGVLLIIALLIPSIVHIILIQLEDRTARVLELIRDILWVLFFALLTGVAGYRIIAAIAIILGCISIMISLIDDMHVKKEKHYVNHWSSVALESSTFHRL